MSSGSYLASVCRNCRFYTIEGRRGGYCHQLNVQVHGAWKACPLAMPPFAPPWESFQEAVNLQQPATVGHSA